VTIRKCCQKKGTFSKIGSEVITLILTAAGTGSEARVIIQSCPRWALGSEGKAHFVWPAVSAREERFKFIKGKPEK
jgi:hypothetical protein